MRIKKILKRVLLAILVIWIIISAFFYFQHRIQVETCTIGRYIEFEEFSVLVKNIERYNFEKNGRNYPNWIIKFNLPSKVTEAILKTQYFYSFPYHVDNKALKYDINCEIIFDQEVIDAESVEDLIREKFNIALYNNNSSSHIKITENKLQYNSNMNIIYYTYTGNWQQNYNAGVKIINIENDEEYIVQFDNQFLISNYGYFNRKLTDRQKRSSTVINNFIWNYYNGDMDDSQLNINNEYIENYPWNKLNLYENFFADNYELSYLGHHMNDDQVFIMKVLDNQESDLIKELEFYMIYEDFRWQIIDMN